MWIHEHAILKCSSDIKTLSPDDIPSLLVTPQSILDLPVLKIDDASVPKIYNGQSLSPEILTTLTATVTPGSQLAMVDTTDALIAIATFTCDSRAVHPTKVFRR